MTILKVTDNHSFLSWCGEVKDSEETEITGITRMVKCLINSQSTFTGIILPDPHNRAVREVEQLLLTWVYRGGSWLGGLKWLAHLQSRMWVVAERGVCKSLCFMTEMNWGGLAGVGTQAWSRVFPLWCPHRLAGTQECLDDILPPRPPICSSHSRGMSLKCNRSLAHPCLSPAWHSPCRGLKARHDPASPALQPQLCYSL